jgi:hypothetical protein
MWSLVEGFSYLSLLEVVSLLLALGLTIGLLGVTQVPSGPPKASLTARALVEQRAKSLVPTGATMFAGRALEPYPALEQRPHLLEGLLQQRAL